MHRLMATRDPHQKAQAVSAAPPGRLQANLAIGRPGDAFEQEADSVADSMTQSAEPAPADAAAQQPEGQEGQEKTEQVATVLLESEDLEKDADPKAAEPALYTLIVLS